MSSSSEAMPGIAGWMVWVGYREGHRSPFPELGLGASLLENFRRFSIEMCIFLGRPKIESYRLQ